jgi:Fur family peroxide stress response transcriptional regulator
LDHPSAEAVLRALQSRMPTVSLDTVYRTLWLLNYLGLVSTLGPKRESVRFDANLTHHHHYVCVRCGLAHDFESAELNALRVPASVEGFGTIDATHVEVRGVCSRCAKEQAEESEKKKKKKNIKQSRGKERSTP